MGSSRGVGGIRQAAVIASSLAAGTADAIGCLAHDPSGRTGCRLQAAPPDMLLHDHVHQGFTQNNARLAKVSALHCIIVMASITATLSVVLAVCCRAAAPDQAVRCGVRVARFGLGVVQEALSCRCRCRCQEQRQRSRRVRRQACCPRPALRLRPWPPHSELCHCRCVLRPCLRPLLQLLAFCGRWQPASKSRAYV